MHGVVLDRVGPGADPKRADLDWAERAEARPSGFRPDGVEQAHARLDRGGGADGDGQLDDGAWGGPGLLRAMAGEVGLLDVSGLDPGGLDEVVAGARQLERAVDGLLVRAANRADEQAAAGAGPGPDGVLSGGGDVSAAAVRAETARAGAAAALPAFGAALAVGAVGAGHLDAVARALGSAAEAERTALAAREAGLLAAARRLSVDSFSRHLNRAVQQIREQLGISREPVESELRLWEGRNGVGRMVASFGPEEFERVRTSVEAEMAALCRRSDDAAGMVEGVEADRVGADGAVAPLALDERLAAQALVSRLTSGGTGPVGRPSITLVVDAATLRHGAHAGSVCETPGGSAVPVEAARRCACDAVIRKVVVDERGVPIDVGRRFRTATDAQWAALRTMYTGCAWFGCDAPLSWCQAHHVIHWTPPANGPTDLANLVPLCGRHHHLAHEGGWHLVLDPDRALHLHQPDGTRWRTARPDRLTAERWPCPSPADTGSEGSDASCPPPADRGSDRTTAAA